MLTFARWVSTSENRAALIAVQRVADCLCSERLRREINPVFVHGPAGTGKTHLVTALASDVMRRRPDRSVALLAAGDIHRFAQDQGMEELAANGDSDLLIVEDMQHLRSAGTETFVQMLDARVARQQQTVCTAAVGPGQLTHLPVRLTSRLAAGLVVGMELLSPPSRLAFLQDGCQRRQLVLSREVLAWLAEHAGSSGRQLEGALTRVETLTRLLGRVPDLAAVADHFGIEAQLSQPTVERIVERVGACFQVNRDQMQSRRRWRNALLPRQVGMYLVRQLTPLSLQEIGSYFGGRDHSTVLHACRKVEQAMARDAALSGVVRRIHADLA